MEEGEWVAVVALACGEEAAAWRFRAHLVDRARRRVMVVRGEQTDAPNGYFNDCCYPDGLPRVFTAAVSEGGAPWDRKRLEGDIIELSQLDGALSLIGRRFAFRTTARLDRDEREAADALATYFPQWKGVVDVAVCLGIARLLDENEDCMSAPPSVTAFCHLRHQGHICGK